MATVTEIWKSRSEDESQVGEKSSASKHFIVEINLGSETEVDAMAAAKSAASLTYLGFDRKMVKLVATGAGIFEAEATYDSRDQPKAGETTFSFDISDLGEKAYYSLATMGRFRNDGAPLVDFKGGINVDAHSVGGIELNAQGSFMFNVTKTFASPSMTAAYIATLYGLRGCINDASWTISPAGVSLTFLEGEARFVGAQGGFKQDKGLFEVGLKFACQRSIVSSTPHAIVVGGITVTDKRGWDYLWVHYKQGMDNGALIQKAKQVNIEQVYFDEDFTAFGL